MEYDSVEAGAEKLCRFSWIYDRLDLHFDLLG